MKTADIMTSLRGLNIRSTVLPLAFFTLFFLVNAILGYYAIDNIAENQDDANQSLENINSINEVYIAVLRAETTQRTLILTDLPEYNEQFEEVSEELEVKLQNLSMAPLNEGQTARAYDLQVLISEKLSELRETLYAVINASDTQTIRLIFSERNRNLMNEISELSMEMETAERYLLAERAAGVAESRITALYLILTSNLVGLVMVFVALSLVKKGRTRDALYAQTLQKANDTLEEKVRQRTYALEHFSNELKRSNRELQDFAHVASHDLQEPLRKIRAFSERLRDGYSRELDEQGRDYIARMQNACERMSVFINDLLTYSKVSAQARSFAPIKLNNIIEEVLEDLEVTIEESGSRIVYNELPEVDGDYLQMKQLFQNLIGNAIKFRHPTRRPEIFIHAVLSCSRGLERNPLAAQAGDPERTEMVEIEVKDNGVGFDDRYLDRIFVPFQRLHGRSQYEGTGIGLSVCRRIVERHGGTISAVSKVGVGSAFYIRLPLSRHQYAVKASQVYS